MPLTATKGEGGEASRSRARRRRRRRRPAHTLTPAVTDGNEAQTLAASSDKRKDPPEQTQSESWKRARAADQSREDEGDKKGARGTTAAAAASASSGERHASSSEVSSPLRWPYIAPITEGGNCSRMDPAIEDAFDVLEMKYREKRKNQLKLVTLDPYMPPSCMENANLLTVRESATQIILEEAKVVLSLSSYVDGELVAQSSGFLIDWDENSKTGTVLTSALLICKNSSSSDQWLFQEEYVPNVEVCAQLLDKYETVVPARLLHFDKHFNIALFKVHMNSCARIPTFNTKVMYGQGVFVLSRDKDLNLDVKHGHVQFRGPTKNERHHFLFMGCMISQAAIGGPVIDHNGQILGMVTVSGTSFIPSSVILKCLDMFKKFNCIPRLHIGMQFSAIKFLDLNHVEKISRKCNVSSGLIVTEVSHGLVAEKLGIRIGDIIVSIDGECIATTVELENLLLQMCESHLDKKISIGSSIDVPLNVFHTRIGSGRTINLRLNISDELEVFSRGDYLVSARDCA